MEKQKNKTETEKTEVGKPKKLEDFKTMGEGAKTPEEVKEKIEKETEAKAKPVEKQKPVKEKETKTKTPKATATKITEKKGDKIIILEREYVIPLRRYILTVPRYRRAKKAIMIIRQFLAKHMKTEDRNVRKIKIDKYLNSEIWFRGIKNPPSKIKVIAKKDSEGLVWVELAEIPDKVKFDMEKDKKRLGKLDKKALKQIADRQAKEKAEAEEQEKAEEGEDTKEEKEKEKAVAELGAEAQEKEAKEMKHTTDSKRENRTKGKEEMQRKALQK